MFNARPLTAGMLALSASLSALAGTTLYVPTDYSTIQAAIDAADPFDPDVVVLVADGIYTGPGNRDIDFQGKAITVRSENGPDGCVIDCQGSDADPHRAFYFTGGETESSVLDGFTIRNAWMADEHYGGAVGCINSSPLIQNCNFEHNYTGRGGAIHSSIGLTLIDCTFFENSAEFFGGAIYASGIVNMTNCTFTGNTALGGGAIQNVGVVPGTYTNCVFVDNVSNDTVDNAAGAFRSFNSVETMTNCTFVRNRSTQRSGAMWLRNGTGTLTNCTFVGNFAGHGGALGVSAGASATLNNCLFARNEILDEILGDDRPASALWIGDGIGLPSHANVRNCTFAHNVGRAGVGAIGVTQTSSADVANCVFWGNTPTAIVLTGEASIHVTYSDVQGGWPGVGNIDADPLFVRDPSPGPDGDWGTPDDDYGNQRLTAGSPCIDAGDPAFAPSPCEHDLAGACRVWDGNADTLVRVDMGAYEFAAPLGDLDGDCVIGLSDLTTLLAHFGGPGTPDDGNLNGDGVINLADLSVLLSSFGSTCP